MRDPYEIFARHILGLKALEPLDAPVSAAEYGSFIHRALDLFISDHDGAEQSDPLNRLLTIGHEVFEPVRAYPSLWAFWWPRFERVAAWVRRSFTPAFRSPAPSA